MACEQGRNFDLKCGADTRNRQKSSEGLSFLRNPYPYTAESDEMYQYIDSLSPKAKKGQNKHHRLDIGGTNLGPDLLQVCVCKKTFCL